ncbi:MAG: hypothetical protein WA842_05240 [Croceibacterium sp.]
MNEPRPFASLGPTLLARKGGARPAMRPQLGMFGGLSGSAAVAQAADDLEDLGWNDMGEDHVPVRTVERLALTPAPTIVHSSDSVDAAEDEAESFNEPVMMPEPAVKQQLRAIAAHLEKQEREPRPTSRRPALEQGRRAAFTLRLDAQRHLKLRLACTIKNRSAQVLLTEALDRYLAEINAIEALAAQVKRG